MGKYLVVFLLAVSFTTVSAQDLRVGNTAYPSAAIASSQQGIMIPNAFTPNGDGRNDLFKLVNTTNERLLDFRIFNRWGTILYRSPDDDVTKGWDGNYKNQPQPTGVYGYVIRIAYSDGNIETYKGTVTLIR